jgi:lipopolysaccharide transport system permease protein
VKVRYKQTALGVSWAVLQPVFTMLVFTLFFGRVAKIPSDGIPYALFSFAALVPWTFFQSGLSLSSNSLIGSSHLITKVYFPRLAIPIASVLAALVDFGVAFLSMLVMMIAFYHRVPTGNVVYVPAFAILALTGALGTGLWLSAINVRYRDVKFLVPFLVQIWMFASPVVYPSSLIKEKWRLLYALNPMVGVIDGFRWALLGKPAELGYTWMISAASAILILVGGAFLFRRMERSFADFV